MENGNSVALSTINFKVNYSLNPSLEGKTIKVQFIAKLQSGEILKKIISLEFKEPLDFSNQQGIPKVRSMNVSN
jgi:hypothetical protein